MSLIGLREVDPVEGRSVGVVRTNGGYLALTLSQSKHFKTLAGATRWLAQRGYNPDGSRKR